MLILGIESSCDDTSIALVQNGQQVISECTASQTTIHQQYGGIVPEVAAREHFLNIDNAIYQCIEQSQYTWSDIDLIATTCMPGLANSLLVGISAGKILSHLHNIPIYGINHLYGHLSSVNLIPPDQAPDNTNNNTEIQLPFIGLLASGGHTQLYIVRSWDNIELLGATLDDSAGETFDKIGRMMGLPYPGGVYIEELANKYNSNELIAELPHPKVKPYQFSFSGLKTAAMRFIDKSPESLYPAIASTIQHIITESLCKPLVQAAIDHDINNIMIAGGVSANKYFRNTITNLAEHNHLNICMPARQYCMDNGAMIASAGYYCPSYLDNHFGIKSKL